PWTRSANRVIRPQSNSKTGMYAAIGSITALIVIALAFWSFTKKAEPPGIEIEDQVTTSSVSAKPTPAALPTTSPAPETPNTKPIEFLPAVVVHKHIGAPNPNHPST